MIPRFFTNCILFAALIYASCACASDSFALIKSFDFKSAVGYAIKHSPDLDSFRRTHNISKIEHKNKKADFLPNVDIASTHKVGKKPAEDNSNSHTASSLGIEVTENLYKNGENITKYKKTKFLQEFALLKYKQKRDQLIKTIAGNFLDFSLDKKRATIQQKKLTLLKNQYHVALKQHRQGLKQEKDVSRFKSQMHQAEIDFLLAKNRIEVSKQKLLANMGVALNETGNMSISFIPLKLPVINVSILPVKEPVLNMQYQYKMVSLQRRINVLDINLAKRKYWPEVYVKGKVTYGNDLGSGIVSSFGRKKDFDWQAGLELKYKLLDWGKEKRNIDKAAQEGLRTIDGLNQELLLVKQDIANLISGLILHKRSYVISGQLQKSQYKNYLVVGKSYRSGDASYLDLTEAIKDLSLAELEYAGDRYALEKDLYSYYYYTGTIYEKVFK